MLQVATFMLYFATIIHSFKKQTFFLSKFNPVVLSLASNLLKSPKFIQNVVTSKVKIEFGGSINLIFWFLKPIFYNNIFYFTCIGDIKKVSRSE